MVRGSDRGRLLVGAVGGVVALVVSYVQAAPTWAATPRSAASSGPSALGGPVTAGSLPPKPDPPLPGVAVAGGAVPASPSAVMPQWSPPNAGVPPVDASGSVLVPAVGAARLEGSPLSVAPALAAADPSAVAAGVQLRAGGLPVGAAVAVRVLGASAASAAGGQAVAFRLSGEAAGIVHVRVDYSSFAELFGGGWASRLQLVQLPACAQTTPGAPGCAPVPVASTNDLAGQAVEADVAVDGPSAVVAPAISQAVRPRALSAATTTYALTASSSGSTGNWSASSLNGSLNWSTSSNTGSFGYAYDVPLPPAAIGATPKVTLTYDSSSVDGQTAAGNTQASWVGEGWDLNPGFIERSFTTCPTTGDLCSANSTYSISFGPLRGELIVASSGTAGTEFRVKDDPGWRVVVNNDVFTVTDPHGTQYTFGRATDARGNALNSAWRVPVFQMTSQRSCTAISGTTGCVLTWRWNLDGMQDANGNAMTYTWAAQSNNYMSSNGTTSAGTAVRSYTAGGYLVRLDYGQRVGSTATPPNFVSFSTQYRCLSGISNNSCAAPTSSSGGSDWPDVPTDQLCSSSTSCGNTAPAFFTTRRLDTITTYACTTGACTAQRPVQSVALSMTFPTPDSQSTLQHPTLWLAKITRTGSGNGGSVPAVTLPSVLFYGTDLVNRVDYNRTSGALPMFFWRVSRIVDEMGGQLAAQYGHAAGSACTLSNIPDGSAGHSTADQNALECFPVWLADPNGSGFTWWHKYVVVSTTVSDNTGAVSPAQVTDYVYGNDGNPMWHYNDSPPLRPLGSVPDKRSWSQWRGYATLGVEKESTTGTPSYTRSWFYRGMDGDKTLNGTRSASVTDADGAAHVDNDWLASRRLEQVDYGSPAGSSPAIDKTLTSYATSALTADGGTLWHDARIVAPQTTSTTVSLFSPGGTLTGSRTHVVTTTVFDQYMMPEFVIDYGDPSVAGDTKCTQYAFARNTTSWILDTVSDTTVWNATQNDAIGNVVCAGTLQADTKSYYDAQANTAAPTRGNLTMVRRQVDAAGTWATTSQLGYDAFGRVVTSTDGNGNVTSTDFEPHNAAIVTYTVVTDAAQHATTTNVSLQTGAATSVADPNSSTSTATYDALGRRASVTMPTEQGLGGPTLVYTYTLSQTAPSMVETAQAVQWHSSVSSMGYAYTYAYVDGLGRTRQVQTDIQSDDPALFQTYYNGAASRTIVLTSYDDRGLATVATVPTTVTGAAGSSYVDETQVIPNAGRSVTTFDGLGRPGLVSTYHAATLVRSVSTAYLGDRTIVDDGTSNPTTTSISMLGRALSVDNGGCFAQYGYDTVGDRTTIRGCDSETDTYDMTGRVTNTSNGDRGQTATTYDPAGNVSTVTDALGNTRTTTYDALNRPTNISVVYASQSTPNTLTTYGYDTATNGIGRPATSMTYANGATYINAIGSYDADGHPTSSTSTIPSTDGLAGSYTTTTSYNARGDIATVTYPQVTDSTGAVVLAAETVTTGFTQNGFTNSLSSPQGRYVDEAYAVADLPVYRRLGDVNANQVEQRTPFEAGTNLPNGQEANVLHPDGTGAYLINESWSRNGAGDITAESNTAGNSGQTQCFSYDGQQQLTRAFTTGDSGCSAADHTFGPVPYDLAYTYTSDGTGNIHTLTDAIAGTTGTYAYASPHTHAVTSIGNDTYQYNNAGALTSQAVDSVSSTFSWDGNDRLSAISGGSSASFVYDATGNRLIRTQGGNETLYLPGTEITKPAGGGSVTALRYYTFGGATIAVRGSDGVSILGGDQSGSTDYSYNLSSHAAQIQRYTPFGTLRGDQQLPGDHRYLGQPADTSGLSYLNARYYNPAIGRFISPDPLGDGYRYADDNPVTYADPTGLCASGYSDCGPGQERDYQSTGSVGASDEATNHLIDKYSGDSDPNFAQRQWSSAAYYGDAFKDIAATDGVHYACAGQLACLAAYRLYLDGDMAGARIAAATYCISRFAQCTTPTVAAAAATQAQGYLFLSGGRIRSAAAQAVSALAGSEADVAAVIRAAETGAGAVTRSLSELRAAADATIPQGVSRSEWGAQVWGTGPNAEAAARSLIGRSPEALAKIPGLSVDTATKWRDFYQGAVGASRGTGVGTAQARVDLMNDIIRTLGGTP
jgi:RHS repeat-associated protein